MSVRGTQFEVIYREKQAKVLTYEGAVYVVPEGSALKLCAGLNWMENGVETDTISVQYSTISQFVLSVGVLAN